MHKEGSKIVAPIKVVPVLPKELLHKFQLGNSAGPHPLILHPANFSILQSTKISKEREGASG
jgi:hypothetical protein